MSASAELIEAPPPVARLIAFRFKPMLSRTRLSSSGGISRRILRWIAATIISVSSSRVPGGRADMELEGAGVGGREEVLADERDQCDRERHEAARAGEHTAADGPAPTRAGRGTPTRKRSNAASNRALTRSIGPRGGGGAEPSRAAPVRQRHARGIGGKEIASHRRDQGPRQEVRGQHREHHRHGERPEERRRRSGQEEDRQEHDRDGQSRDERRRGDLRRSIHDRLQDLLPLGQVPVHVLDLHRRVIHQNAHGQREPAKRHHVEGLAQGPERDDGAEHRERNRGRDDERAAPAPQEEQDHERRETGGDDSLVEQPRDRAAHEDRLIRQELHVERSKAARV